MKVLEKTKENYRRPKSGKEGGSIYRCCLLPSHYNNMLTMNMLSSRLLLHPTATSIAVPIFQKSSNSGNQSMETAMPRRRMHRTTLPCYRSLTTGTSDPSSDQFKRKLLQEVIRESLNTNFPGKYSAEVADARQDGSVPVIALESTIVSHGMPHPQNLEAVLSVESIVRGKGCVPATIALHDGLVKVGLELHELEDLAHSGLEGRATKCTTRELGALLAHTASNQGAWASTTVASTCHLAELAGVEFFVTGGTGGVHRGYEQTMDASADLTEVRRRFLRVANYRIARQFQAKLR